MPILPANPFWASCDEMYEGRGGTPYALSGNRQYKRRWMVVVLKKEMQAYSVCLCPGLPLPGSFYTVVSQGKVVEYDTQAILTERSAYPKDDTDWAIWYVDDTYSTQLPGLSGRTDFPVESSNDPTQELADVSWDFESVQEAHQKDLWGYPYLNTAKQPMNPPPMFERNYPVLTISRNELNFNYATASIYALSVNKQAFLGAPPGAVLCLAPRAQQKNRGMFRYWRTTYRLKFRPQQFNGGYILPKLNVSRPRTITGVLYDHFEGKTDMVDTWQPLVLNQGMYRLAQAGPGVPASIVGTPVPIYKGPHQVQHNVLLDQFGQESKPTVPNDSSTIEPWYIEFHNYRETNFKNLLVKGVG